MASDKRKFRGNNPVSKLGELPDKTNVRTNGDRTNEFIDGIECVRKFAARLQEIVKTGDQDRIEKVRNNLSSRAESARAACARLKERGIDPKQVVKEYMSKRK